MALGTGIQVGTAHILIVPQLSPGFGTAVSAQMGTAGKTGGAALANGVSSSASSQASGIGSRFGSMLLKGLAAVGLAKGISSIFTTGFEKLTEESKGLAQLQAGLKSTGDVAGLTAEQMIGLAKGISGYSGQTSGSIVATEQLLLTFTNVRNSAGKNNDIFTQTTKIAADMAARLGGDASSSAIKLGKALQDPVKGMTSLARVGVMFTAAQKAQVAALMKTGDTLGAQKIILAELTKEFGGSAAMVGNTLAGQVNKAKNAFGAMSASIVSGLLPAFNFLLPIMVSTEKAIASMVGWLMKHKLILEVVGGILLAVYLPAILTSTAAWIAHLVAVVATSVGMAALNVVIIAVSVAQNIAAFASKAWAAAQWLLNAALEANPIVLIVTLLVALGAAIYLAWTHCQTFRDIVLSVWHAVEAGALWMWNNVLKPIFGALSTAWQWLQIAFKFYWDNYAHPVINAFVSAAQWLWGALRGVFGVISGAWNGLMSGIAWVYYAVVAPVWNVLIDAVHGVASAFSWVIGAVQGAWNKLVDIFKIPINATLWVVGKFAGYVDDVTNAVGLGKPLGSLTNLHVANGLRLPGYGGGDIVPALLEPGEAVVPKHLVPEIAGWAASRGIPGFASGGLVGVQRFGLGGLVHDLVGGIKDLGNAVVGLLRSGAGAAADAAYQLMLKPVLGLLGSNLPGRIGKGGADTAEKKIIDWIKGKESVSGSLAPGVAASLSGGVAQWVPMIVQVMAMLGMPPSLLGRVEAQMSLESSGNPNAINNSDSNAAIGQNSRGLMQTVPGTFAAYAGPFVGRGIYDPLANIYAGLNYAMHRYSGDPNFGLGYGHGYAGGGVANGWSVVGENGPELINAGSGSRVLSHEDSMRALGGRGGMFAGANVTIGEQVDLDLAVARYEWNQRAGSFA